MWVIGPGGLSFPDTGAHGRAHFETSLGKSLGGRPAATLHAYADWSLMSHPNGRNVCAFQIGSNNGGFVVIDTGHYAIGDAEYDSATSHTVTLGGALTLAEGAYLGFNFTEKAVAPQLVATSATLPATVTVKVSSADGLRVKGGKYALTSGGSFTGANVALAEGCPHWAKGVSVVDGEIVLNVTMGTFIVVR